MCAGAIYVVLLGSPTGLITLFSYGRCAASSLHLWGNTDVVLADNSFSGAIDREQSKGISGAVAEEDLQHNQVPNHKSHLLAIYIICLCDQLFLCFYFQIY